MAGLGYTHDPKGQNGSVGVTSKRKVYTHRPRVNYGFVELASKRKDKDKKTVKHKKTYMDYNFICI